MINSANTMHDRITPDIEKLLEIKFLEIDKNLLYSLAFADTLPHISELCDNIAEESIEDVRIIGLMLLGNGYNPTVRLHANLSSIDLSSDKPSKAPYTAVSVINHNIASKRKIANFIRSLLARDILRRLDSGYEALNTVYLRELERIENLQKYIRD